MRLSELFAPLEDCGQAAVWLYGRYVTVAYQCFELYWDTPDAPVLLVLTQLPGGKPFMLLATDVTLTGPEVIEADGWRCKIEVTFRTPRGISLSLLAQGRDRHSFVAPKPRPRQSR